MRKGKHLGPHGIVDAVFLLALFDSSFGYIHDAGLGDALCRSSCGAFCASTYQKKGRKRGARAMAPLQVPHDNLLVMGLPEDFFDFSDSLATNEVSSISIDQPCLSCFPVPLPRSAPLRPATGHPHLFEFFFATTVTSLGGLCCPSWRLSRKPCARHRIFCSLQESNPNQDTVVVRERPGQGTSKKDMSPEHCLWQQPCGCSLHLNHVQFRFRKRT